MTEFFTDPKLNDAYTETLKNIKQQHQKIMVLYKNLKKRTEMRSNKTKYQSIFGMFVAEYVKNLNPVNLDNNLSDICLQARRLLELWISVKYINQKNLFAQVPDACDYDRLEYLEGLKERDIADGLLFPSFDGIKPIAPSIQKNIDELKKACINKTCKWPPVSKMAAEVNLQSEYKYFYKFSSKILHFCPFSLNNDPFFEGSLNKLIFLMRIQQYLARIKEELDGIYNKTKLVNL